MSTLFRTLIALMACITLLAACKQNTATSGKPVPPVINNVTSTLYEASTARQDIACFDTLCSRFMASAMHDSSVNYANVPVRAFTIHAEDLFAAMGMEVEPDKVKFEHIRVYLAYSKEEGKFKLFIVPVQGASIGDANAGSDILLDSIGNPLPLVKGPYPSDFLSKKFVLDLNAPCPNLCDTRTPLLAQ